MKYFLIILSFIPSLCSHSQMTLDQIIKLPYGENYKIHEKRLKGNFSQTPVFMKADFNGAFYLVYENVEFDNFGKANYEFHYIKNKLASAEIAIEFYKERFSQIKEVKELFEDELFKNYKVFLSAHQLGEINKTMEEIKNCNETGNFSNSLNKTLFYKHWEFNKAILPDSKSVDLWIFRSANEIKNCRAKMEFDFSRSDLKFLEMDEMGGHQYIGIDEYSKKEIKLKFENGVYNLPVKLNNNLTLDFVLDLGASDVSISPDVFLVLLKTESIAESDFIGEQTYQFADGSTAKSKVFNLKSSKIGEMEIQNVRASVSSSVNSPLLLGQSALKKLGKYQIDNDNSVLIIE